MIEVYIDGSSKGNPGPGGAGIVIQDKAAQKTIGIHGIPLGYVTNNQAEFLALKHALIKLKNQRLSHEPVNILTDSQLVVGIFSQNWKARANLELMMEIRNRLKEFPQVTFAYVRGHNGNHGNELADSLAQEAAESQKGIKRQWMSLGNQINGDSRKGAKIAKEKMDFLCGLSGLARKTLLKSFC